MMIPMTDLHETKRFVGRQYRPAYTYTTVLS
jgi:hypothetical protein